jgi:TfoX/Sxy family transcriptional regulator of competence genes
MFMAWRKAPQSLVAYFDKIVPQDARIERRKMFGYPAAFINGNLFASLFQESCILRLRENDRDEMRVAFWRSQFRADGRARHARIYRRAG